MTVDRKKELIKVRGFQVAPPELEAVLLSHPHIVDAAVIGVQPSKDDDSEYPRAYITKRDSKEAKHLETETVKKYMAERLAKFKRLDGGVVFLDEIVSISCLRYAEKSSADRITSPKIQAAKS